MMDAILENQRLARWAKLLPRGPSQHGAVHESDAELLPLGDGRLLALTVDQVAEEVTSGLYTLPETVGRIAATAALSDMAAVGAEVLGLLVSVTLPSHDGTPRNGWRTATPRSGWRTTDSVQEAVARGIRDVAERAQTHIIGGDTSYGPTLSVACTAAGTLPAAQVLTRLGAAPGDCVYATGPLGLGAAFAAVRVLGLPEALFAEFEFRPELRLKEGKALRGLATCCMDTSDGLIATLDQLTRLNRVSIRIDRDPADILHPAAKRVRSVIGVEATAFLAAVHGEFELVFTVPESRLEAFEQLERSLGITSMRLGRVEAGQGVCVGDRHLDTARIRNLSSEASGEPRRYLRELLELCS